MSNEYEDEFSSYYAVEFLAVDTVVEPNSKTIAVGMSLAMENDGDVVDVALSVEDAEKLILALARACYDVRVARGEWVMPGPVSESYKGPRDRVPPPPRWAYEHLTDQEFKALVLDRRCPKCGVVMVHSRLHGYRCDRCAR